eukprot:3402923-Rhodomonas_salina.2
MEHKAERMRALMDWLKQLPPTTTISDVSNAPEFQEVEALLSRPQIESTLEAGETEAAEERDRERIALMGEGSDGGADEEGEEEGAEGRGELARIIAAAIKRGGDEEAGEQDTAGRRRRKRR